MKISTIIFFALTIVLNPIFSQSTTQFTFNTKINIEGEGPEVDTVRKKLALVLNELEVAQQTLNALANNTKFISPGKVKKEDYHEQVDELIQKIFTQYYQENESLIVDMITNYLNDFTIQEIRELIAFYETDLGKKILEQEKKNLANVMKAQLKFEEIKERVYVETFGKKALKK